MSRRRNRSRQQTVLASAFGLLALVTALPLLAQALVPELRTALAGSPSLLGPALASLGSALMVWFRDGSRSMPERAGIAIGMWIVGALLAGAGAASLPALTLGGAALGLTGIVLALLGVGLYWYDGRNPYFEAVPKGRARRASTRSGARLNRSEMLARATEYREGITRQIRAKQNTFFADRLALLQDDLTRWEERVRLLSDRLAELEADEVIDRDRAELPATIKRLEAQAATETNPDVKRQIEDTLTTYREQQAQLDDLSGLIRRTELQLDSTVAAMGTIYSQLRVLDAMEVDSARAASISEDIEEQVNALGDLVEALGETHAGRDGLAWPPEEYAAPEDIENNPRSQDAKTSRAS